MDQEISQYTKSGQQTEAAEDILKIAGTFEKKGVFLILEILEWLHKNIKERELAPAEKKEIFRKRAARDIIESGFATGCTDFAIVFVVLARAKGIPAKYVEVIEREWLEKGGDIIQGHAFSEVYLDGNWLIVDPQGALIKAWYGKRYVIYGEGLDSADLGINNFDDLKNKFSEFRENWLQNKN